MNEGIQLPVLIIQSPAGSRRQERFSVPGVAAAAAIRFLSVDRSRRSERDHVCGSRMDHDDGLGLDQFGDSSPAQHSR